MRWMAMLAAMAACRGDGSDGDGAHVGVDDTAAVGGGDEGGLVWVDAEGVEVPVVTIEGRLYYVDEAGLLWSIYAWAQALGGESQIDVTFADPGCTEAWSGSYYTPRVVIEDGAGDTVRFFVVPDDAAASPTDVGFRVDDALGCVPLAAPDSAEIALVEVTAQAVWWTPPLHPEYR